MPFTSNILFDDAEERDRKDQEQDDQGLTQFGAGFSAGIKQTQGLLGGGLPALIQSAIGDEDDAFEYLQYYNQKMQEAADIGGDFQRVEDIDGAEDAVQWLTYTLGQALPSIGTSIIGGGLGGAAVQYGAKKFIAESVEAQVKKKAGDAFEKAMVKRELSRRTAKARRLGQGAGAFVTSAGMNAGETFANVYEESGGISDPALALGTGIAAGALDALAPLSILKKILPDNMAEPFKEAMADRLLRNKGVVQRAFIEGVRTGGIEGATEAAQEVLQATAVGMFNDPEGGYKSYGESFFDALNNPTEQQSSQYLNAFAAGLVGGGGMGGVSGAMYKPRSATEVQEEEAQQSPMPDSEGNMPVETPQSEELEAQQAGFDSYADYLDAYETGPARMNRGVSLEAIQNIIPDEYYLGQDISEDENARLEAETLQLRDDFNPSLNDLVGQVVGQGDSEGVLIRREDGVFAYTDLQTGEEVTIESGEANQDQPAEVSGLEQRDSNVELEGGSGITFNSDDSTFTARRGTFRYFSTNYDENGEVSSVTAETMDGKPRTFGKKMAARIEDAKAQSETETVRQNLATGESQQEISSNLGGREQAANQSGRAERSNAALRQGNFDPASFEVQADDLPEDLQVALVQSNVIDEAVTVEQVEEIIETMPEARQEPLRKRIESLMTRDEMEETPIAASTFDRTDETSIFNGVINRAGSVTLEERQANLDATAGQEIQQPNGDDPIVIPSTGLENIAEKVSTAMRNQFKVRNRDKTVSFYQPANKYLGEANQDITEEIQQAVFDLVESGMAPEAISSLDQISVHTDDDFNGADGVALASGVSLRDGVLDKARTDEGASSLRMILAHEMHHVFDLNNDITLNLPSFKTKIAFSAEGPIMTAGDVVVELYDNYVNQTEVGRLFAYPFNMLDEDTQDLNADFDMLGRTMEQEVFAQLGAVYVSDPRLLKSQAPEAYEVIRTIRGADNATDQNTETQVQPEGTGVQGEVRPSTVSGSAEVEDAGGTGVVGGDGAEAGPTSEVVGGETQQPDGDSDGRVVRPEDLVIKRADNFTTNGEYNVTFPDGSVTQIFRDTLQFSTPRWIWVESDAGSPDAIFGIGDNRNDAVQRLIQLMGYELPPADNVLLMRSPMGLVSARETAAATSYPNQRPFKVDLQQKSLDEQERMGLNLREDTEEANKYLVEITVSDAQEALVDNENAIGWYDRTVGEAINTLSKIHPEIATDPQAKFAFTFALANTSNGLKVDKNFELAESAYRAYKDAGDGKFPTNVGIGNAAAAINKTFKLFNDMVEQYGISDVMELFNSKTTVGELQKAGFKVTGEWVDTEVYGAAIIGPKIGNGFFANLNGNFDQLTMDRWLRRTWGRWTGTLIGERPDLIADKTKKMRQIVAKMTAEEKRSFRDLGVNIRTQSNANVIETANAIQKASMIPANREVMNRTDLGQDLRKVGNGLAKDADGQIEAPTAAERNRIRKVFNDALTELRNDYPELTMADLQALLWYPEKRLYDGARSQEEFENGYEDAEAPDYANAAARLAERFGVDSDRRGAGDARSGDVVEQPAVTEQDEGTATPEVGAQEPEVDTPLAKRGQKKSHADAQRDKTLLDGTPSSNEFTLDDETRGELFLRKIQDKYFSLKKFEDAAAEFLGLKELPEHMQTYVPETLHSGKIKTDFDELETTYVAPLSKILRDNDIDPDDFGLYLMAKHAPERNRRVATLYQERDMVGPLPDFVGAGMSTEDANRVVSELENPSLLKAAEIVYDMLTKNRERMVEAGLINEDTSDSWNSNYQFYVPLKGFATTEDESGKLVAPKGLPKGFSVSGKESFKALGRTSQAENPVLFALADSEEKIVRGRRNEVGQQFLALADAIQERGSEQLKTYRTEDVYPTVRAKDSKGKYINKQMRADEMRTATRLDTGDKRFLSVKVDGEEIFIEIENAGLNRAMHNVGAENFAGLTGFLGSSADFMQKFQNFRRNMLINWNPSWFLINPLRDIQTGLMYNLAEESKEGGMVEGEKLTGEILRRYLPAYKSYYKNLRGNKADNEYDAYFTEYQQSGAPTGLTLTKDIEEQRARLNALLTDGALVAKGKQGLQEIEYLNQASENAVRFSTYVSARESGVSVQKAANLAKNLTVNFNRKGELSSGLNLFYLFFNAAVQGTANIAQAMSGRTADGKLTKAQVGAASIALVAYMVTQHNLGAADEDEDGESVYSDLSDYDHLMSWNMVLNDGKTFAQIPMPYGYGFFHTLGRLGAEYMNDTKDEGDVAAEMTASFAHHMLPPPLGFVGSVGTVDDLDEFGKRMLGNIAPSILEPAVQYATNTNHFGSPLYLEGNPLIRPSAPDSSRAKRSTSKVYQDIAEWMNDATGGSLYRSGAVDVSPDGMQYLQEYLLGGLGRFVNRSADLAAKYNSPEDEEVSASDIPIVRYFFGEPSEYSDKMDYYGYISSATQVFKEASESTGQERVRFQQEFKQVISLEPLYKEGQKKLRKLRQRKKQIEKTQNDPVKAYDQIQKIEAEMQKVYDSFNKRYREATR